MMTTKEQIAADWNDSRGLRVPKSWKDDQTPVLPLIFLDSLVAGCVLSYLKLRPDETLDERRIDILARCYERLIEAQEEITDAAGQHYLQLTLRITAAILADMNKLTSNGANMRSTP